MSTRPSGYQRLLSSLTSRLDHQPLHYLQCHHFQARADVQLGLVDYPVLCRHFGRKRGQHVRRVDRQLF